MIFAQATTVGLALLFVLSTLKPDWLRRANPAQPIVLGASAPLAAGRAEAKAVDTHRGGYSLAAKRAAPAVVSVMASKAPARNAGSDERWHRFHFGPRGQNPPQERRPQTGLGSGVIVSEQGYLLTNSHVVEGASDIEVMLTDGRQARASLVGTDPETDIAVLKIDLPGLPVIQLGQVEGLQVGDVVLAIGNPFNVGQTVTSGIVSALERDQLGINTFENFIQTDAAINPGNSGGALVDEAGRLVGINTAIYSRSGGSLGIGFAIPINTATQVMESLLRDGQVQRGWIGVQLRELTPEFAEAFKLPIHEGVLISGVLAEGPAAKAGVKPGDVIVQVGKAVVHSPAQLLTAISAVPPKSATTLSLLRGQQKLEIALTVAQRPKPRPQ
ncbi:Do/DeqQ family serine protease [Paucibacter oligotrophus]|uniref:Do/DeqQ family serine protease n=1 Tax=Roseateles oligotrophus TaxID=1769250 RepID=A0A840L6T0_9BURK|nr:trypsin-like peptidase domain-containing protein [Roseateles oligotrophus]MBB4842345.1 Do/DeqQ family serine protease [Roseateles oligotrophus]